MKRSTTHINLKTGRGFALGAIPSPRHKLLATPPHVTKAAPAMSVWIPTKLSYWLNDQDGDCVSAEEAFAKGAYSVGCGLPDLFIPDSEVQRFAAAGGFLNGAMLTDVMDAMAQGGFQVSGQVYKDGPYTGVNYNDEANLQSALTVGPVKIAIDHTALPQTAGNQMGWFASGGSPGQYTNTDHCVGIGGYGPAQALVDALNKAFPGANVTLPPVFSPTQVVYLLFTWNSIGLVDIGWVKSTTAESYVRNPTTPGQSPLPPAPIVPPAPLAPATISGTATGGTFPVYSAIAGIHIGNVSIPDLPVTGTVSAARKVGVSLSTIWDIYELIVTVGRSGGGPLVGDLEALLAAVKSGAGIVAAAEQLVTDLVAVGANPLVLEAVDKVLADLGVTLPPGLLSRWQSMLSGPPVAA